MKRMSRKAKLIIVVTALAMVITTGGAFACTGVYIGKNVSKEGTTVIARSEDQGTSNYEKMFKVQKRVTKAGRYMVDTGEGEGLKVPLPKTTFKYTYVPDNSDEGDGSYPASCTNEYGLAVVGTVSSGYNSAYEKVDPYVSAGTGLREAILPALIACQCKTAKGAVAKLAALLDKYGSEEGNILFFADQNEAWIFEIYGGHEYCAQKMPADKVAVFGNQFMISGFDPTDTTNFVYSKNLVQTLKDAGGEAKDGKYDNNVIVTGDYSVTNYSTLRTWMGHKILSPSTSKAYNEKQINYPLFFTPDENVSVTDVMNIYRNRYEGTDYDMSKSENASLRPIGVNTQSDVHIIQVYKDLPKDSCSVQWLCMGNAEYSLFIPSFSGITDTYKGYKVDSINYTSSSLYWDFKRIDSLAESDRTLLGKGVQSYWQSQEAAMLKKLPSQIKKVKAAYKKSKTSGRAYVTSLGKSTAATQVSNSNRMYKALMDAYINNQTDKSEEADQVTFTFK